MLFTSQPKKLVFVRQVGLEHTINAVNAIQLVRHALDLDQINVYHALEQESFPMAYVF
jgi:hypothetical protein